MKMVKIKFDMSQKKHIDVVLGKDTTFPRTIAINMLPESRITNAPEILNGLLIDKKELTKVRHLAAINLWRVNTKQSRDYLISAAETEKEPDVLTAIVKSLGRIGDEQALSTILKIKKGSTGNLADQANFAASLLSYRLGLENNEIAIPAIIQEMPKDKKEMAITSPDNSEREQVIEDLKKEPFGIVFREDQIVKIDHPAGSEVIVFNKGFPAANVIETLKKRKTLLGIIATKKSTDGTYHSTYLILTSPNREKTNFNILITRINGESAWAGTAISESNKQAVFSLKTVGKTGITPMEAQGTIYSNGKIEISAAITALNVIEKKHPEPLTTQS
jgi:hypothetical protein